ncbi:DUF6338 family protein [Saliphagus sp. GCM10025334]
MIKTIPLQTGQGLSSQLFLFIFLLIPGYISFRTYLRARYQEDDYNRFDKWVLTIMFGFVSLVGLSILHRWNPHGYLWSILQNGFGNQEISIDVFLSRKILLSELGDWSVLSFVTAISVQSVIGGIFAYCLGSHQSDDDKSLYDLEQPWETALEGVDRGDRLRIITRQGRQLEGQLHQSGSADGNYDLLLRRPSEISVDVSGEEKKDGLEKGRADVLYCRHQDISHVQFIDYQLPDKDKEDVGDWPIGDQQVSSESTTNEIDIEQAKDVDIEIEEDGTETTDGTDE